MGNKKRSQKKINASFGISMVDLVMWKFPKLGQRKMSKKNIKNSIKKCLKISFFQLLSIKKFPGHERTYFFQQK